MTGAKALRHLATTHSLLTSYTDAAGQRQVATDEALIGVLRALGVEIDSAADAEELFQRDERPVLEPVIVAWDGRASVDLALTSTPNEVSYQITMETGETVAGKAKPQLKKGEQAVSFRLSDLPVGYHELRVRVRKNEFRTRILSAPRECYSPPQNTRDWGVFLPIYALHSKRSWGGGDLGDFEELTRFIEARGGSVVATLPLLATFLGPGYPFEPSPYSPASRLFWNELYVDLTRIPELETSEETRSMIQSSQVQQEIAELRAGALVDYRRQMALKRRVLESLAQHLFHRGSHQRGAALKEFISKKPEVEDYAQFRAVTERQQKGWPVWEERIRNGDLRPGDFDESARQFHLYAQWVTHQQIDSLARRARSGGRGLYLDLPLGVHPDGYDVWRHRDVFATGISVGAPPDPFFTKGQNWGFPPLHPERQRQKGYEYLIGVLRHHMASAGMLRLDHVMSLHRLYWIPEGQDADKGVYVKYPAEELNAIIAIESHRHQTMVVGEDLGTVPNYVRESMTRHNLRRMFVLQYEARSEAQNPVSPMIPGAVASLNTHDMPPFHAFWQAGDVDIRVQMGLLDDEGATRARESREKTRQALSGFLKKRGFLRGAAEDPVQIHDACMTYLSRSEADVVLVSLEDLWLEREPQNVPGTSEEKPNWRRKARKTLEAIESSPSVTLRLKSIDLDRRR